MLNNEASIVKAFGSVSESTGGGEWCLLDYDGNSNIVQVAQRGGEVVLAALLQRLHSGHVQYGFFSLLAAAASEHQQQAQRKIVMIHWVGNKSRLDPKSRPRKTQLGFGRRQLGPGRLHLCFGMPQLGPGRPQLGPERPQLGPERPQLGRKKPY